MDFTLTEEQELLKKTARGFFETDFPKSLLRELEASPTAHSPELWKKMAAMDWLGLVIPEEYGGLSGDLFDLAIILEEAGRAVCMSPLFNTIVLGALPIIKGGTEEQKKTLLPKIASGDLILTLALTEPEGDYDPKGVATRAEIAGNNYRISGTKLFIPYANVADRLLTVARTSDAESGISLLLVDRKAAGLTSEPLVTIAGDKQFEVRYDNVLVSSDNLVGPLHGGWPIVHETLQIARALQSVELVGIAARALEITAQYTPQRVQFDRPIGSFQAVQMRLANMLIDVEGARWSAYQAAWRVAQGLPADREIAIAQAWGNDACQRVVFEAHRLHGGIGLDVDYDLQFHYRRAKALELNLRASPANREALEAVLLK